jgi:hypothetical protein
MLMKGRERSVRDEPNQARSTMHRINVEGVLSRPC